MISSDLITSARSYKTWALVILLLTPWFAVSVSRSSFGTNAPSRRIVSQNTTSTTTTSIEIAPSSTQPLSTPRFRNGTWSRALALPGTPPNHWWLIDYWNNWNYYGSFTAVGNSITGLSTQNGDAVLILPMNLAYGSSSTWQWFQFDMQFDADGTIWWGIWNVDSPGSSDSDYHPHTLGLSYTVGHTYHYQGSVVSGNFRFQIWDDSLGTTWYMDFDIPSTSQFYNYSAFSPASAVEGYTTPSTVGNVPYYQFTIGYGMTSFTFGQYGSGVPNGIATDRQNLGGTPSTWHWKMTSGIRDFRVYSLPMSYLGQDPESVKLNDLHAQIKVDYVYQGQIRSTTSNAYFDLIADIGSSISFTVTSTPFGWSFANKWDHYGYSQHSGNTLTTTVVSGSGIDRVAAFFNPQIVQITVTSSPTGYGFVKVDGSWISTPQVFAWVSGSSHALDVNGLVSGGTGIQYVWMSWSDGGSSSHTITVTSATTYTANFKKQYLLTTSVSPTGAGVLSVSSGWRDDGVTVSVTATVNTGYSFYYWSLDGTNVGSNPSYSVLMNSPHSLTAYFRSSSSISAGLSAGSIALGASVTLSGTITPAQASPGIPTGPTVTLSYSLDGATWNTFITTKTSSGGAYSIAWYPPYGRTYQIKASWSGDSNYEGSTSSTISLTVTGDFPRISLLVSGPSSTVVGSSVTFDVIVNNPGSLLSTALYVEVTGPGGYWYFDTQQITVAAAGRGRFQFTWQILSTSSAGQYQVFVGLIPPKPTAIAQTQITILQS
ncbi:Ig-like domain repeat protein [Candidatus Bathyarchaeota archaeon]|nr:Ig-like domain repeat protein [Candidatus Bathyarchaeota archaeon]